MKWSTVEEAAPVLGISKQGMYDAVRKNQLPPDAVLRIGKRIRINLKAFGALGAQNENKIDETSGVKPFQIDTIR